MATMRDVSKRAGVSITTVSHVINETRPVSDELRDAVFAAIEELNYEPNVLARNLRRSETRTIGLIVPNNTNPFYAEVARGVEAVGFEEGYSVTLCNSDRNLEKELIYTDLLFRQRVDGVIFVGAWVGNQLDHLRALQKKEMPMVVVDRKVPGLEVDIVVANNLHGGQQATTHLLNLGHQAIACIAGYPENTPNADRVTGYRQALQTAGVAVDERLIIKADFQFDGGYKAARQLLSGDNPPTAIFACNDLMGIGAIRAVLEMDFRVPEDVSIVGFDDIPLANFSNPSLTTIAQPMHEMGVLATKMLLDRIREPHLPPQKEVLETHLITRQSTAVLKTDA